MNNMTEHNITTEQARRLKDYAEGLKDGAKAGKEAYDTAVCMTVVKEYRRGVMRGILYGNIVWSCVAVIVYTLVG